MWYTVDIPADLSSRSIDRLEELIAGIGCLYSVGLLGTHVMLNDEAEAVAFASLVESLPREDLR